MDFEYRYLGRTGIRVSPLCLGCMMFGGKTTPDDSYAIIDRAINEGINFLDTANVYSTGQSEIVTGEALKRNGHRDRIVLATKCHGNMFRDGGNGALPGAPPTTALHARLDPNKWGNSRRQITEQCHLSLKRLQTDYIDLYQIHRPHPDCATDEMLRAFDDLIKAGKVRYIGCSTFAAWQVVDALWCSDRLNLNRFVTEQPPYNLLDRRIERELIPMARTFGMGLIPWSPLAGGFLTGKYARGQGAPDGARITKQFHRGALLDNTTAYDIVDKLRELATTKNCTVSQLALAWCVNQPGITSPIIGPRTMEQLEDNLGSLAVTITDDDRKAIDEIAPPGRVTQSFYEASFGPSVHRW
ncbi:MAG: aldo/keto reductase [Phycisphaera sp.]|nr:aldo/keto reductase [Phycisphaera sp.]